MSKDTIISRYTRSIFADTQALEKALEINLTPDAFITHTKGPNGQILVNLSKSTFVPGEASIRVRQPITGDIKKFICDMGISLRTRQNLTYLEFAGKEVSTPTGTFNIVGIYQCSATLGAAYNATPGTNITVTLDTPLPSTVHVSDVVDVSLSIPDIRAGVSHATINWISDNRKTFCTSYAESAANALAALTYSGSSIGTLYVYDECGGALNAIALKFDNTTVTSATVLSRFGGANMSASGNPTTDSRQTVASSGLTVSSLSTNGEYEIKPNSRFGFLVDTLEASVFSGSIDSASTMSVITKRTSIVPDGDLYAGIRIHTSNSVNTPAAKILQIQHTTASPVSTVTLDVAPSAVGLVTGTYVTIRGVRDQTNFATSGGQAPILAYDDNAKTITVSWGASAIATSNGGVVLRHAGLLDSGNIIGGIPGTVYYDAVNDVVYMTPISTWAYLVLGELVDVYGVVDTLGNLLGIDGTWELMSASSTLYKLKPVYDYKGVRKSPNMSGTTLTMTPTDCGGALFIRTTARIARVYAEGRYDSAVTTGSMGISDSSKALPVVLTSSISQGAALSTTSEGGAWPVRQPQQRIADYTSVASTTSTNGTAINNVNNCGGYQVTLDVTAVSGTNPRMYGRIQESLDGGNNWFNIFDFPPCSNNTDKTFSTPVLPTLGSLYRFNRTLTGTSPSFTNSISRSVHPGEQPECRRQLVDRVVSLTTTGNSTEYLYVDGCRKGQIVLILPAVTTAPTLKLQVCDDVTNGGWYDVPNATLTAVSNSTTASVIFDIPAAKLARLVVTGAGAGITADTYTLMVKTWE